MKNELDLSMHSITVESLQDAIDGAYAIGYPIAITARGVTESQGFVAHNERDFITMAYDALLSSDDDCIILKEFKDPEDILDCEEGWDEFDKIFKEVVHPMHKEADREEFNEKCRMICGIAKDAADFCGLDPWNDTGALGAAVEAVMAACEIPFKVYSGSLKEAMREYVDDYGDTGETDEQLFQKLCIKIKTTFESEGYCLDTSTYNPYHHNEQLMGIVELVVQNSQQPFTMQNACGGPPDMMSVMRGYVTKYSDERYLPEIYRKY